MVLLVLAGAEWGGLLASNRCVQVELEVGRQVKSHEGNG